MPRGSDRVALSAGSTTAGSIGPRCANMTAHRGRKVAMNDRVMIATIVTHPGKRDELKKVFAEMFPVAATEPGTMFYTLIEGDQPDTLYFYEHYRDQAAMDT